MIRKLLLFLTLITSILVYGQEVIFNESNVNHTSGLAIFENQLYIAGFFQAISTKLIFHRKMKIQ
jgi:hypothetical protein